MTREAGYQSRAFDLAVQVINGAFGIFGRRRQAVAAACISARLVPVWNRTLPNGKGSLLFWAFDYKALWRGWTAGEKEPDTVAWIDGMKPGEVLWDVGANVGVFSLYAARGSSLKVLAFEPEAGNYQILARNIDLNRLDGQIQAYCMAFSGTTGLGALNMRWNMAGASHHHFGTDRLPTGETFEPIFRQGVLGLSIDDFMTIFQPPFPDHIKIDVDGIEGDIVRGAEKAFCDPRLKSVLIEIQDSNPAEAEALIERMKGCGFSVRRTRRNNHIFERIQS
jgi:FkbM family methyltransferase